MGGSLFASGSVSGATGCDEAYGGKREVRPKLANCDRDGMLPGGGYCRATAGIKARENITDIWAHDIPVAIRDHCDDVHAGAGICDRVLGYGWGFGTGFRGGGG